MKYILSILTGLLLVGCTATKKAATNTEMPAPKQAVVSGDSAYTDQIELPFDDQGQTLTVQVAFNEKENLITCKVTGLRKLIGFQKDTRFRKTFRWNLLLQRVLHAESLTYPALVKAHEPILLNSAVWKNFSKKRSQHLFNEWIKIGGKELALTGADSLYVSGAGMSLVTDTLVRYFKLDPKADKGTLILRNILTVDEVAKKKSKKLRIAADSDLRQTYNLVIQRDPCFYTAAETDSVNASIPVLRKAYENFLAACPDGMAKSNEEVGIFNQHRKYLLAQYPAISRKSKCPELQEAYDKYNSYLDSIRTAPCKFVDTGDSGYLDGPKSLNSQLLYNTAHRLDNLVSQILLSRDVMEKRDLTASGRSMIRTLNDQIAGLRPQNEEQAKALKEYRKSESFFNANVQF